MEAIYFGNAHWHGNTGAGTGPWAGADLEQGMYYGGGLKTKVNNGSKSLTSDFVSLALKGRTDGFDLKGGDATKGELETQYSGPRPDRTLAGSCRGGGIQFVFKLINFVFKMKKIAFKMMDFGRWGAHGQTSAAGVSLTKNHEFH